MHALDAAASQSGGGPCKAAEGHVLGQAPMQQFEGLSGSRPVGLTLTIPPQKEATAMTRKTDAAVIGMRGGESVRSTKLPPW